jgi:hypothetical protein
MSVKNISGGSGYGPGATTIDTNQAFNVKNELVSTTDFATFWKMRTTLSQSGRSIVLESDCKDYLSALNDRVEGKMGIVVASWENSAGTEKFE